MAVMRTSNMRPILTSGFDRLSVQIALRITFGCARIVVHESGCKGILQALHRSSCGVAPFAATCIQSYSRV